VTECVECGAALDLADDVEVGEIVDCGTCGSELEVVGVDPVTMLKGPVPATRGVLEKADMDVGDIDLFEVNEAFAAVIPFWLEEIGASWEDTNVNGGAIAHGHPLGATGAALLTKLAHELERTGQDYGLSAMCIGFGQGVGTIIERV